MKKIVTIILAVLMLSMSVFLTFGCSSGKQYDPDNFLPNGVEGNSWQIVKEPITLKVFVPFHSMHSHYSEMKLFKVLSERTNIKFDFVEANVEGYSSLRSTAWEDKDSLPDIFLFSNVVSEQVVFASQGALTPLNDPNLEVAGVKVGSLLDYAPDYKKGLETNFGLDVDSNAQEIATFSDGKMYSFVSVNSVPRDLTFKMYLNVEWIDSLNQRYPDLQLQREPQTVDEYLKVLRAFKKYDANRNGDANDEIPVSATKLDYLRNFILASYGYVSAGIEINQTKDAYEYVPSTNAYRNYLKTLNVMYEEELLDNSTFEMSSMADKGYKGILGSFSASAPYLVVGQKPMKGSQSQTPLDEQYSAFGPLLSNEYTGNRLQWNAIPYFQAIGAIIPTGTPYVREIARLLNLFYTEEGIQLQSFGVEGEDFTWDNEEKDSFTFNIPEDFEGSPEEYRAKITPNVGLGAALWWDNNFVGKQNDEVLSVVNKEAERYLPYLKDPLPGEIKLTAKEYERIALIETSLNTYIESAEYNFITGVKDPESDKDWQEFIKKLEDYNYKTMLQIYNDALNRYSEKN